MKHVKALLGLVIVGIFTTFYSHSKAENSSSAVNANVSYVSKKYGIPIFNGHLVFPARSALYLFNGKSNGRKIQRGWNHFLSVNYYLGRKPDFQDSVDLAKMLFSKKKMKKILKKYSIEDFLGTKYFATYMSRLDEFDQQDFIEYMQNVESKKLGKYVTGKLKVVITNSLRLGRYNVKTSSIESPKLGRNVHGAGYSGRVTLNLMDNRLGIRPNAKDWAEYGFTTYSREKTWSKHIPIPKQRAEAIIKRIDKESKKAGLSRTVLENQYGTLELAWAFATFEPESLELTYISGSKNVILPTPLAEYMIDTQRQEKQRSENKRLQKQKSKQLALLKIEQKKLAARVEFAPRTFDLFGVHIGMSVDDSVAAVRKNSTDLKMNLQYSSPDLSQAMSSCGRLQTKLREIELEINTGALIDGRDVLNNKERTFLEKRQRKALSGMPQECSNSIFQIFETAFTLDINYGSGVTDKVSFFQSGHPDLKGKIVGIARTLYGAEGKVDVIASLKKKYGSIYLKANGASGFWTKTADVHNKIQESDRFRKKCIARTPWPANSASLSDSGFKAKCGIYLGVLGRHMYIVDTDYVIDVRRKNLQFTQSLEAVGVEIKF